MDIRVKLVLLLVLGVSLLMAGWGQAEPVGGGSDQIQPYETDQARTNTVAPSYQEYTPPNSNWANQDKTQDQSEANRVAQKVQNPAGSAVGATKATTKKHQ